MPQSNIYGAGAASILELFSDYVEGEADRAALVLGTKKPSPAASNALEKSLAAFGFGDDALSYATTIPLDGASESSTLLDPQALFLLVEGIDPILLVCTDAEAISVLAQAYRIALQPDSATRVFGRPAVLFEDLDALVATDAGKQKAWKLLKALPRR